jgi:hypothetical protein
VSAMADDLRLRPVDTGPSAHATARNIGEN